MKIVYRPHLRMRIKERKFPKGCPKKIYKQARRRFFDTQTGHNIAISRLEYAEKLRDLAISYDIINKRVEIITIHPVPEKEIRRRIIIGRWKKNEKSKN